VEIDKEITKLTSLVVIRAHRRDWILACKRFGNFSAIETAKTCVKTGITSGSQADIKMILIISTDQSKIWKHGLRTTVHS
jgi:hypothetical protein